MVAESARTQARRVVPIIEIVLLLLCLAFPVVVEHFWVTFGTKVFILSLFALSFDLVWGYAGILSFGQALFFGVASYSVALMATKLNITTPFLLLPAAAGVGLLLSIIVAYIVILGKRVPTMVFVALGTLTGSYVIERLARGWSYVGGQNGIPGIPIMTVGEFEVSEGPVYYYMALAFLVIIYLILRYLTRSQFGLVLAALRQRERRIAFFGYRVQHFKAVAFAVGGTIAGLAGGLYAFHEGFVWPSLIGPVLSTQGFLYVMFGGVGTLVGGILGAGLVEYLSFMLSQQYPELWPVVLGLLLLIVVMFKPTGLIGFVVSERERIGSFGRISADDKRA